MLLPFISTIYMVSRLPISVKHCLLVTAEVCQSSLPFERRTDINDWIGSCNRLVLARGPLCNSLALLQNIKRVNQKNNNK